MISNETSFSFEGLCRGLLGIIVILIISIALSNNRKAISWRLIIIGIIVQIFLGIGVIYVPLFFRFFEFLGNLFIGILSITKAGTIFIFGDLVNSDKFGYIFAFQALPPIIVFSAIISVLHYFGIIQLVVKFLGFIIQKLFSISGAESLATGANIFLGQSESPLLVRTYLGKMSSSEIFLVMVAGMSMLAGGILAVYIGFLGGNDKLQQLLFAKHLIAASVMAAPGAIVIAKTLYPQTETIDYRLEVDESDKKSNILSAMSDGAIVGVKLVANIAAILIVFIAFIALFNFLAAKFGDFTGINDWIKSTTHGKYSVLSLQCILGYLFAPIMWLIGVSTDDIFQTGRLLGEKIILTEFIGYKSLTELKAAGALFHQKSIIMSAYFLSGFANFASIGIQIGTIGTLAPEKRGDVAALGIKAMVGGTLASLLSACIIGILIG